MRVRANIQDERVKIQEFIRRMAQNDELLSECLGQQRPTGEEEEKGDHHGMTNPGSKRAGLEYTIDRG